MIVAWTGHRPDLFLDPESAKRAVFAVAREVVAQGEVRFVTGGQRGVDTWAAQAALELAVPLTLILPLRLDEFAGDWTRPDRTALQQTVARATEVAVADGYSERNREIVRRAELLVAVWTHALGGGTAETLDFARQAGTPVREIVLEPASTAPTATGRGI